MLRFWKSFTLHGYQVNQDDEDPTLFYIIPSRPTIGLAGSGDGVLAFNFRKYRFADAVADGRKGGGYLMFDVSLEVPPADLEIVGKALKDQYAAATVAKPIDDVTDAKLIKLSPAVPFTDAHVTLNIGKDDKTGFVESVTSLGRPSTDGRYTVSFSAALGPEGATYFENAMKGSGAGAVQVMYSLSTFFRSGDTKVVGSFNKKNTLDYLETRKRESKLWRESSDNTEITTALLKSEAVKVDATFSNNESPDQQNQIRKWATDAVMDSVKRQLPDLLQPQESTSGADNISRKLTESSLSDFSLTFNERIVMKIELNPQGMLPNVGAIINRATGKPYEWKDYFEEVDLDDPWFRSLNLGISNMASFDNTPLSRMNVDLSYTDNGKTHATTLSFSKDDNKPRVWSPFGTADKYQYSTTAYFDGGPSFTSPRLEGASKELVVGNDIGGLMQVDAIATGVNFDMVRNVAVTVQIVDSTTNAKGPSQTVFLDAKTPQARVALLVGERFAAPYTYETTLVYTLPDGVRISRPAQLGSGKQLLVLPCFTDVRTIQLGASLGAGDTALVTLDYAEDGYRRHASLLLDEDNKNKEWKVGVIDPGAGRLSYSATFDLAAGGARDISTRKASGDRIWLDPKDAVAGGGAGVFELTVDPTAIDWDAQGVYNVTLTLVYGSNRSTLSFTGADHATTKTVRWERLDDVSAYSWKAVYICKQAKKTLRIASTTQTTDDIYLLLPSPDEVEVETTPATA